MMMRSRALKRYPITISILVLLGGSSLEDDNINIDPTHMSTIQKQSAYKQKARPLSPPVPQNNTRSHRQVDSQNATTRIRPRNNVRPYYYNK
jgi:hypothetical protein